MSLRNEFEAWFARTFPIKDDAMTGKERLWDAYKAGFVIGSEGPTVTGLGVDAGEPMNIFDAAISGPSEFKPRPRKKGIQMTAPEIDELLEQAKRCYDAMSPLERAVHELESRRSWVRAELQMNDDASPNGRTAQDADEAIKRVAPEYIVLDAYKSLRESLAAKDAEIARLEEALKPFADAVYNDNGDMTIRHVFDNEAYIKAYFVRRALSALQEGEK